MTILDLIYKEFIALLDKYQVLNIFDLAVLANRGYSVFDKDAVLKHMEGQIINHSFCWEHVPIPQNDISWRDLNDAWEITFDHLISETDISVLEPLSIYYSYSNSILSLNIKDNFITEYNVGGIFYNADVPYKDANIIWPYSESLLESLSDTRYPIQFKEINSSNILIMSPLFSSVLSGYVKGTVKSVLFSIKENPVLNYIDLDPNTGKVSYLNKDKIPEVREEDYFTSRKRTTTTIGKLLMKLDTDQILDKCLIEDISNYFRGIAKSINVQVWEGDDIKKAYLENNYAKQSECVTSVLHNSCMRHTKCQSFFDFYKAAHAKIAVLLNDEGKIDTRALLWEVSPGIYYLDRIYYNTPFTNIRFVLELQKKYRIDFYRIDSKIYSGKTYLEVPEGVNALNYSICTEELKNYKGEFPYVDTFCLFFKKEGRLYPRSCYILHRTDGQYYIEN